MMQRPDFLPSSVTCTHLHVELMVQVPVNLLGVAVLLEHATKDAQAPHPQDLSGQAGLPGSSALACADPTMVIATDLDPNKSSLRPVFCRIIMPWFNSP